MKKTFIAFISVAVTTVVLSVGASYAVSAQNKPLVSMKAHETQGLGCKDCHGMDNPTKAAGNQGCLSCHANSDGTYRGELDKSGNGVYKTYSESRKTKDASFHDSHVGKLRCDLCHTAHKAPDSKNVYCNYCHQFEVKIK